MLSSPACILLDDLANFPYIQRNRYAIITDMEPKLPSPNIGPEVPSANYGQRFEQSPDRSPIETNVERGAERFEQRSEAAPASSVVTPILPPPVVAPFPLSRTDSEVTVTSDGNPIVANDDDLIEKEWVDKAKKIIVQTKDDPYRREQEVGKLQADYLQKRYGRVLGDSQ